MESSIDEMPDEVLGICNAYEQGYGKGIEFRKCVNPYTALSNEWWAWDYGYGEGNRAKINSQLEG